MLTRLAERLAATRRALAQGFGGLLGAGAPDPAALDELESALLGADVGIEASGLHVDPRRPLIEIYFDNPRVVPAEKQRIDICMPVAVDEAFGRTAA